MAIQLKWAGPVNRHEPVGDTTCSNGLHLAAATQSMLSNGMANPSPSGCNATGPFH
jgi:hypothetical protein